MLKMSLKLKDEGRQREVNDKVSFWGINNTGKSALINAITV